MEQSCLNLSHLRSGLSQRPGVELGPAMGEGQRADGGGWTV